MKYVLPVLMLVLLVLPSTAAPPDVQVRVALALATAQHTHQARMLEQQEKSEQDVKTILAMSMVSLTGFTARQIPELSEPPKAKPVPAVKTDKVVKQPEPGYAIPPMPTKPGAQQAPPVRKRLPSRNYRTVKVCDAQGCHFVQVPVQEVAAPAPFSPATSFPAAFTRNTTVQTVGSMRNRSVGAGQGFTPILAGTAGQAGIIEGKPVRRFLSRVFGGGGKRCGPIRHLLGSC